MGARGRRDHNLARDSLQNVRKGKGDLNKRKIGENSLFVTSVRVGAMGALELSTIGALEVVSLPLTTVEGKLELAIVELRGGGARRIKGN